MLTILSDVLPFFGVIALGVAAGALRVMGAAGRAGLNAFVFYAAMPALVFVAVLEGLSGAAVDLRFVAGYGAAGLVHFAVVWTLARGVRGALGRPGPAAMAATLGNTTFLGLPLTVEVLGPAAMGPAALALLIDNAVLMPIAVAAVLGGRTGDGAWSAALGRAVVGVVRNPIVLGALAGVAAVALDLRPPAPALATVEMLARAASPTALFALGALIAAAAPALAAAWRGALGVGLLKLGVFPALAWIALERIGVSGPALAAGVIMAGAPTAVNVFVQTAAYGEDETAAAAAVVATTAVSFLTLSGLIGLLA